MTNDPIMQLVARYGWRITSLDARRAGVPERVLFDAVLAGRAKLERTHLIGATGDVSVYLVFA